MFNSTVSENVSLGEAGGLFVVGNGNQLTAMNTTISSNRSHGRGGGISFDNNTIGDLNHVTITGNRADQDDDDQTGGSTSNGGGIYSVGSINGDSLVTLDNSIVWGNFSFLPAA